MASAPRTATQRRLVSVPRAAQTLGVHGCTIRRWIAQGLISGYRVGPRLLRVDMDEIERMARRVPAAG